MLTSTELTTRTELFPGWWSCFLAGFLCLLGRLRIWMVPLRFLTSAIRVALVIMENFVLHIGDTTIWEQRGHRGEFLKAATVSYLTPCLKKSRKLSHLSRVIFTVLMNTKSDRSCIVLAIAWVIL